MKKQREGLHFLFTEFSARVVIFYSLSSARGSSFSIHWVQREGLHFLFTEFSARVFIFYLLSSWFSPYVTKGFSFWIQKFSRCIKGLHKMSLELEVLTSLSMIINLALSLELWTCCWKSLQASIAFGFLVSFLWLFNLMLNVVSAFPMLFIR